MLGRSNIIKGKVHGTGWPIDGHVLRFALWDYDKRQAWHLYDWEKEDDEAVMLTFVQTMIEAGFLDENDREEFIRQWQEETADVPGAFALDLDQVEIVEGTP